MLERDAYPPGVPCWVDTGQPDPEAAIEFYGGLFGWEFEDRPSEGSSGRSFVARLRGGDVAGVRAAHEGVHSTPAWSTYVAVDDADETVATTLEAGGSVTVEPYDVSDAGRGAVLADPSGAEFCVWQTGTMIGAQLVNEPGTWNFSELNTPDPDGAIAFYRVVFGWEVSLMGSGAGGSGFFRMPGYGDFLEQRDPDVRERQSEVGAPEGFEDAVAWLIPTSDVSEAPPSMPHWSVTFAIDDADAVAERAGGLGGTVLVPPTDAPWVRMTVIRDPQGAAFTASKFVPPS